MNDEFNVLAKESSVKNALDDLQVLLESQIESASRSFFLEFCHCFNLTFYLLIAPYKWKVFENKSELIPNAVSYGKNLFVGRYSTNGNNSVATIDAEGKCYFLRKGRNRSVTGCYYLWNEPGNFQWIQSRNGIIETGAVRLKFNAFAIGRIRLRNGKFAIGKITQDGLFYEVGNRRLKATKYFALVYKPLRI